MSQLNAAVSYFLSFKVFVMLPVIILILALVFGIKLKTAIKSALTLGIGFIGIFTIFDFYVGIITPAVNALVARTGLGFSVLDTGWIPLSVISWQFHLAPVMLIAFMLINALMLSFRLTRTVNIDIFNYWHVILLSVMVYAVSASALYAVVSGVLTFVLMLKLSDWSAREASRQTGMSGICIPHLSGLAYYPVGVVGNLILDRIPFINKLHADPEKMKRKIGLLGEPMIIGLIVGALLGVAAGYSVRSTSELAVSFAGVIYILPIMCSILGSALIPVSEGMKLFMERKFPGMGETWIGLDVAVLFGIPSVMVTVLLLIPFALLLAFVLPGVSFIPLGDLTGLTVPVAMLTLATNGNIIRTFILGIPVIVGNLYFATALAPLFTRMAANASYTVEGYDGIFTSFLDGGNILRSWLLFLSQGHPAALAVLPVIAIMLVITAKMSRKSAG